jgi:PAS domain S-box-containing protein
MGEMDRGTGIDLAKKEELRETLLIFESVIRESPLAIDVFDREGNTMIWNPAAERLLGWSAEETLGGPPRHIPEETRRVVEIVNAATFEGDSFTGIETMMRRKDGQLIDVTLSTAPFYDSKGEIQGVMSVLVDISDRKRAENMLRFFSRVGVELTRHLEVMPIIENLAALTVPILGDFVAIDLLDEGGTLHRMATRHVDPEKAAVAEGLRRYTPAEYQASGQPERLRLNQPEILSEVSDTWIVRRAQNTEHLRLLRRLSPYSIMIVPLYVRDRTLGSVTLALTRPGRRYGLRDLDLAQELARRAATAIENARLYEEARHAVWARDEVLAIVSHDLRNPINTISMTAELLREMMPTDEGKRLTEIIGRSTEQMEHLIRDLLDVARIEAGALTIEPTDQDPAEIVRDAVELQQPLAERNAIQLTAETGPQLPTISADRERLLQVFQNLIDNALKFTPDSGTITVRAEPAPGEVRFAVSDNGSGIDPEELPHLFDRFWQAGKPTRTGAGLGLAIVRGIVEAHGGRIQAESAPGAGTTITFTIPTPNTGSTDPVTGP